MIAQADVRAPERGLALLDLRLHYLIAAAVALTSAAGVVTMLLSNVLGISLFALVPSIVVLSAVLWGVVPGLVALGILLLGALATSYLPLPSALSPRLLEFYRDSFILELLALSVLVVLAGWFRSRLVRALEASRQRERLLQNLIDALPAKMAVFDRNKRYLVANRALARGVGLEPADMFGRRYDDVGGLRSYLPPDINKTLRGERQEANKVYSMLDFPIFDVDDNKTDDRSADSQTNHRANNHRTNNQSDSRDEREPFARGVVAFDITELRDKELRLQESQARLRALLETFPDELALLDRSGRFFNVDTREDLDHYLNNATLPFRPLDTMLPSDTAVQIRDGLEHAFVSGEVQELTYSVEINGTKRHREIRIAPVDSSMALASVRDITEQEKLRRHLAYVAVQLRESEARTRALLEAIPDAIVHHNREGRYFDLIPAKDFALAWSPEYVAGQHRNELFTGHHAELLTNCARRAFDTGETQACEYSLVIEGKMRYREVRIVAIDDQEGISIVRDVTEQKERTLQLQASEARNRALLEAIPDAMVHCDRTGRYLDVRVPSDLTPIRPPDELIGRQFDDVAPPDIARDFRERLEYVLDTGERQTYRYTLVADGKACHREARIVKLDDHGALAIVRDITEQTEQERALRDSEARNRALLEAIPDAIIRHDRAGHYLEIVPPTSFKLVDKLSALYYQGPNRVRLDDVLPREVAAGFRAHIQQVLENYKAGSYEYEAFDYNYEVTVDGSPSYREARTVAVDANETVSIIRDFTDAYERDQRLRISEARNQALLEAIPDTIVVFDKDMRIAEVRAPKSYTLLRNPANIIGKHPTELTDAATAQHFLEARQRVHLQGGVERVEDKIVVEGATVYRDYRITRIDDEQTLALVRDITEQKRYEEVLREADRNKSYFLATMSHELRTPLTSVIGFSEMLIDEVPGPVNDTQTEYLRYILNSGQHLLSLLNDVLDLSKVEAGKLELSLSSVDPAQLSRAVLGVVKEKAYRQSITLETDLPDHPILLTADARKLKQMLLNYLSNAAKFTPEGGTITLQMSEQPDEVHFEVRDTGIGIDPKDYDKLFKSFSQIENSETRRYPGTGLGLSLVEKFAELHGGRVWVESAVGEGSTFGLSVSRHLGKGPEKGPEKGLEKD